MKTHIALLRGINVSGQKKIKMADLRTALTNAGLTDVATYIQSGNVIFKASAKSAALQKLIAQVIMESFGFEVEVLVIAPDFIKEVVSNKPYDATGKEYFILLFDEPSGENLSNLKAIDFSPEEWTYAPGCIYLHLPNGAGRTKLSNNFFENKLKVRATTRNLNTLNKLIALAGS